MLIQFLLKPGCIGAADNGDGTYRLDFSDGTSCPATPEEIAAALAAAQRASIPSVSPRQIRQALTLVGLRVAVEAFVASSDQDTKDWWEFSTEFERNHAKVVSAIAVIGVSDQQADDLWLLAYSL